ncbi:MAG TPA: peptidoglycan DD-metalloendopeptidase family protein [Chitinophagaceae bacterium]
MTIVIENIIRKYQDTFYPVVPFNPATQKLASLDLTANNKELTEEIFNDTERFSSYIEQKRIAEDASYLIGGYNELRALYGRSELFNQSLSHVVPENNAAVDPFNPPVTLSVPLPEMRVGALKTPEPRRLHLGTDIWGPVGTPVHAPMGGMIHSFAFNEHYGDYGATIILLHQLDGFPFYTLYGHLSLNDIENISTGQYLNRGQKFATFGQPHENGEWPPHLHFQVIYDLGLYEGDYPGVCRYSERERNLYNCPDPDVILQMNRYLH